MNMTEETFPIISDNSTTENNHSHYSKSLILNNEDSVWVIVLQKSQLVMTIVGFIVNVGTSTTLIKNGQVSKTILLW